MVRMTPAIAIFAVLAKKIAFEADTVLWSPALLFLWFYHRSKKGYIVYCNHSKGNGDPATDQGAGFLKNQQLAYANHVSFAEYETN